jgi:hypothetical protein
MNSKKKREIGLMTREAFDVDVTRVAQEKVTYENITKTKSRVD